MIEKTIKSDFKASNAWLSCLWQGLIVNSDSQRFDITSLEIFGKSQVIRTPNNTFELIYQYLIYSFLYLS